MVMTPYKILGQCRPIEKSVAFPNQWVIKEVAGGRYAFTGANDFRSSSIIYGDSIEEVIAKGSFYADEEPIQEEEEGSMNRFLARLLKTEKRTPAVAEWILELAERVIQTHLSAQRKVAVSREVTLAAELKKGLGGALEFYAAHRREGDPDREQSHERLCGWVKSAIQDTIKIHNSPINAALPPIAAPADEDQFRAIFEHWADANAAHSYGCQACGHSYRTAKNRGYCAACEPKYIHLCKKCGTDLGRGGTLVSLNNEGLFAWFCGPQCCDGIRNCACCGKPFVGKSRAGATGITADELEKQGMPCCVKCYGMAQKADCGHIGYHNRAILNVPNKEDCDENRDHIKYNQRTVCEKCHEGHDSRTTEWKATKGLANHKGSCDEVGSERTYGVELEVCAVNKANRLSDEIKAYWTAKRDQSLPHDGVEFASGVLKGNEGLKIIRQLTDYAHENGWAVDPKAGYHLHVGINDLDDKQILGVALGYLFTRRLWTAFVAKSRDNQRFCPVSTLTLASFFNPTQGKTSLAQQVARLGANESRYVWTNWHARKLHGTLEIRLHQGTLVYEKVANWIKAHTRFIDWCAKEATQGIGTHIWNPLLAKCRDGEQMFQFFKNTIWHDHELAEWFRRRAQSLKHGMPILQGGQTCDHDFSRSDPPLLPFGGELASRYTDRDALLKAMKKAVEVSRAGEQFSEAALREHLQSLGQV